MSLEERQRLFVAWIQRDRLPVLGARLGLASLARQRIRLVDQRSHPVWVGGRGKIVAEGLVVFGFQHGADFISHLEAPRALPRGSHGRSLREPWLGLARSCTGRRHLRRQGANVDVTDVRLALGGHGAVRVQREVLRGSRPNLVVAPLLSRIEHRELDPAVVSRLDLERADGVRDAVFAAVLLGELVEQPCSLEALVVGHGVPSLHPLEHARGERLTERGILALIHGPGVAQRHAGASAITGLLPDLGFVAIQGDLPFGIVGERLLHREQRDRLQPLLLGLVELSQRVDGVLTTGL